MINDTTDTRKTFKYMETQTTAFTLYLVNKVIVGKKKMFTHRRNLKKIFIFMTRFPLSSFIVSMTGVP